MNCNKLCLAILLLVVVSTVHADVFTMFVSTDMTSNRGATNAAEAKGFFDDITAWNTNTYSATGDTTVLNLSNYTGTTQATIVNVTFEIRMNTSGAWADDSLTIQYSNDSGTTWFSSATTIRPGAVLSNFGNYSVFVSFRQFLTLNRSQVRLSYVRTPPADGIRSGVDGIQWYVWYAPPPSITLNYPFSDGWSTSRNITFNFTPSSLISIKNCSIYLNGVHNASNTTVLTNGSSISYINITGFRDGNYTWNVTCQDSSNFNGTTTTNFTLHVDVTPPNVTVRSPANLSTVTYSYVNFTFNVTDFSNVSNCTIVVNGSIMDTLFNVTTGQLQLFNVSLPNGNHAWFINCTDQWNFSNFSGTYNVTVSVAAPALNFSLLNITQGFAINFSGYNWQALKNITLNITRANGSSYLVNFTANTTGNISGWIFVNYSDVVGRWNVTAYEPLNFRRNSTTSFNVSRRIPNMTTDKNSYVMNENVTITGLLFSNLSTVTLRIYNTITTLLGPGFPMVVNANETGGTNTSWNVTNTCSGNYTIQGFDNQFSNLVGNTTFLVANAQQVRVQEYVDNISGSLVGTALSNVTTSDDVKQRLGISATNTQGHVQLSFFPNLPSNMSLQWANLTLEHRRLGATVTNYQVYLIQGGVEVAISGTGCSGAPPDVDSYTTCNITGLTPVSANNLSVRVRYTTTAADAEIDVAYLNYTWIGDVMGCYNFGDSYTVPTVTSSAPSANAVLNAGTAKLVECNITIRSDAGQNNITDANVTFYTGASTDNSPITNVSKYLNTSCTRVESTAFTRTYSCGVQLLYYAANGTWFCNTTGIATNGFASNVSNFTVDPLYAITVNDTFMDFGNLQTGALSDNITQNITNVGNMEINISVRGYGRVMDDNSSFTCATQNLSIDILKFAGNITATYDEKESLANVSKQLRFTMERQNDPSIKTNSSFWQVQIPANISSTGQCNGTIIFQAEMS
jgi:hypothetical protein